MDDNEGKIEIVPESSDVIRAGMLSKSLPSRPFKIVITKAKIF